METERTGDLRTETDDRLHRVETDVSASAQNRATRLGAFAEFPREKTEALALVRRHGRPRGGVLPWAINDSFDSLVASFGSGEVGEIIARAGALAHLAADASDPFRVSASADGRATGNLSLEEISGAHPSSMDATVRERFGVGLVDHQADAYAHTVRMGGNGCAPVAHPIDAAFAVMRDSLAVLDEIATADRAITTVLGVTGRRSFEDHRDAFYAELERRCGPVRAERLVAGARLAAGLIAGAWDAAGRPGVSELRSRGRGNAGRRQTVESKGEGPFMASARSKVFHRKECRFVARILEANRITFASVLQAKKDNRRPCKVCQPR